MTFKRYSTASNIGLYFIVIASQALTSSVAQLPPGLHRTQQASYHLMLHNPDDPHADLSVRDVLSTAKFLVRFHWNSVTKFRAKKLSGKFEFSENRYGEKNTGLLHQSHK